MISVRILPKLFFALLLLTTGCTMGANNDSVSAQFQPPLVYKSWEMRQYTTANGLNVCAVSSGYKGLTITFGQGGNEVVVASDRQMHPGATLTVTIAGDNFETYDTYFTPEVGRSLVAAMMNGGKAYLEWNEVSGPAGRGRIHYQNILQLDEFPSRVKECRRALKNS